MRKLASKRATDGFSPASSAFRKSDFPTYSVSMKYETILGIEAFSTTCFFLNESQER